MKDLRPPRISALGLFIESPPRSHGLVSAMYELNSQRIRFWSAVRLMEHARKLFEDVPRLERSPAWPADTDDYDRKAKDISRDLSLYGDWMTLAAEGGIMTVFHFAKAAELLKSAYKRTPDFHDTLSPRELKNAISSLDRAFPGYQAMRDWIAHQSEVSLDRIEDRGRRTDRDIHTEFMEMTNSTDALIGPNLSGTRMEFVVGDQDLAIDISVSSADLLDQITESAFTALAPLTAISLQIADEECRQRHATAQ